MAVPAELLDLLVCPESHEALVYFDEAAGGGREFLFCPASRLQYRIDDGIPVMLIDEAERLDEAAATVLIDRARELGLLPAA